MNKWNVYNNHSKEAEFHVNIGHYIIGVAYIGIYLFVYLECFM